MLTFPGISLADMLFLNYCKLICVFCYFCATCFVNKDVYKTYTCHIRGGLEVFPDIEKVMQSNDGATSIMRMATMTLAMFMAVISALLPLYDTFCTEYCLHKLYHSWFCSFMKSSQDA